MAVAEALKSNKSVGRDRIRRRQGWDQGLIGLQFLGLAVTSGHWGNLEDQQDGCQYQFGWEQNGRSGSQGGWLCH